MNQRSREVRRFLTAADARLDDAEYLRSAGRTLSAVYLAGYAVECVMKGAILALLPESKQAGVIAQFRGQKAHDFDWLRLQYRQLRGPMFPKAILEAIGVVSIWQTSLRYNPSIRFDGDEREFFQAVVVICEFLKRRV